MRAWASLPESYRQARRAALRPSADGAGGPGEWRLLGDSAETARFVLDEQNGIVGLALRGEGSQAGAALEALFLKKKLGDGTIDIEETLGAVIELVSVLYHRLRETGLRVESSYRKAPDVFAELMGIHTLPALKAGALRVVLDLAGLVRRTRSTPGPERLEAALSYMRHHAGEPLSLQAMAGIAAISPSHFSVLFRKYTGETFTNHLLRLRMEKGRILLASGKRVSETAELLGYEDVSHFSGMFKRHFGESPSAFQQARVRGEPPIEQ